MATTPNRMLLQVNLGTSRSPFSPKIKVTKLGSWMVCALLFHSLDFISFFFFPTKLFRFNLLDLNERLLLVDIFLFAHSWRGKSWLGISLSMKDYGAASRAAKSPLRTLLF